MAGIEFREIARRLSCAEFARAEMVTSRSGRAKCPWRSEHRDNLKFNADGTCYCFACGRVADVVQLAAAVWATDQQTAARELNRRFNLGVSCETMTAAERERLEMARAAERARAAEAKRVEALEWSKAADAVRDAERALERFGPEDADSPAFRAALRRYGPLRERWANIWATREQN